MSDIFGNLGLTISLTILTLAGGAVVGFAVYRLQQHDGAAAKTKRIKRAREELLDVIESQIINAHALSEQTIFNLIAASERAFEVELPFDPIMLLEDLSLRLQKSPHLAVSQKQAYTEQIEESIEQIRSTHHVMRRNTIRLRTEDGQHLLDEIEASVRHNDKDRALLTLQELKNTVVVERQVDEESDSPALVARSEILPER